MIASDVYTYIRRYDAGFDIEFVSLFMLGKVECNVAWQGFILDRLGVDISSYHISYQCKHHC
jgi:hypothetical protein